jgi:hypothetical protein
MKEKQDIFIVSNALETEVKVDLALNIRATLTIAETRELARRLLERADVASAYLKEMRRRERAGFKDMKRYPDDAWKKKLKKLRRKKAA